MRSIFISLVLLAGCATTGAGVKHPVNVAAVRSEINGTIRSQGNDRSIYSMGHADEQTATVYTTNTATGAKQEETWIKDGSNWKLKGSTALAGEPTTAGS